MPLRRQDYTADEFCEKFESTVLFSAIDAASYVDWEEIRTQVAEFEDQLERLESIDADSQAEFESELEAAFDQKFGEKPLYRLCFRLLGVGKSKDEFAVRDGVWDTESGSLIESADFGAESLPEAIAEAGLQEMVQSGYDMKSLLTGIEVGLESNSRKNRQGDKHEELLKLELKEAVQSLKTEGYHVELECQYRVDYSEDDEGKTVDFAILHQGRPVVVFEANCYSAQGSKPSEIRRSYETVARKMQNEGIEYVWVTDGYAWKSSLGRILDSAFSTHPNLYNLHMVREELKDDLLEFMADNSRDFEQSDLDPQSRLTDSAFGNGN